MHVSINGFLADIGGGIELLKSHMYFYLVQTQMHVTGLHWCDFCVWLPVGELIVQGIEYGNGFMDEILIKAQNFCFDKCLPAAVPHMNFSPCGPSTSSY